MRSARFRRGSRFLLAVLPLLVVETARADEAAKAFFRTKVEPILVSRCLQCHADEHKGGLDLTTKATALKGGENGAVIVPHKPEQSLLIEYVSKGQMPPKKPLPTDEISLRRRWIADGAYLPDRTLDHISL